MYGLSAQDAKDFIYASYYVDPDGKFWLLAADRSDKPYTFEFHDDGTTPTRTKLDAPNDMPASTVYNFLNLQNGHVLLQGFYKTKDPKTAGRGYFAEYDSSGKFIRKLVEKGELVDPSRFSQTSSPVRGEDGSIYILEPERVVVLSATGAI
jgi:hypothetical protein